MHVSVECLPLFPYVPREAKGIMDLMGDKPWVRRKKGLPEKIFRSISVLPWAGTKKKRGSAGMGTRVANRRPSLSRSFDALLRTPGRARSSTPSPVKRKTALMGDGDHELWELLHNMDKSVGRLFPQGVQPLGRVGSIVFAH